MGKRIDFCMAMMRCLPSSLWCFLCLQSTCFYFSAPEWPPFAIFVQSTAPFQKEIETEMSWFRRSGVWMATVPWDQILRHLLQVSRPTSPSRLHLSLPIAVLHSKPHRPEGRWRGLVALGPWPMAYVRYPSIHLGPRTGGAGGGGKPVLSCAH